MDVITLDSSSEGEDEDINVIPIVPSPLPLPSKPRRGVEIIHLATVGPKIEPKVVVGYNKINGKKNGTTKSSAEVEEITLLSSSDEDEVKNESRADNRHQPGPSTSAAAVTCSSNGPKNSINGFGKVESNGEDAQDVLHDDDVCEVSEVGTESLCSDAVDNIRKLLKTLHGTLKASERTILTAKIWKKYKKLEQEPKELHDDLAKCIDLVNDKLVENPEFNKWKMLQQLFIKFDPEILRKREPFIISFTSEEQATLEKKKERRKQYLENKLKKISKIVKRLDTQDVDWDSDDEINSSFMQRDRLFAKAMTIHNMICKIEKCSRMTGRPIQKAIDLKQTTTYPEVEERVANYVNRNGYFESPEFCDILEVVNDCNAESQLHLCESDCRDLAKTLHRRIIDRRQQLRDLDVPLAFPPECDELVDPAETDAELEKKLMENAKMARTIKSVVDEFAEKQREQDVVKSGDSGGDTEATPQTNKNDDDGHEAEEEDTDEEDQDEDANDSESILEDDSCFVTSVEDKEDGEIEVWDEPLCEIEGEIGEGVADDVSISPPDVLSPADNQDADISPATIDIPVEPEKEIIINNDSSASDIVIQASSGSSQTENHEPPPTKKSKVDDLCT